MDSPYLYRQIADAMRQEILTGRLKPGDRLPALRDGAAQWGCTIGTMQRAYQELARHGLVTSRAGQGTRVTLQVIGGAHDSQVPLRKASLVHRAEAFLLESITAGYQLEEITQAVRQAMDRWRIAEVEPVQVIGQLLRFVGSHDLIVNWLGSNSQEVMPGFSLQVTFAGSLRGLVALSQGVADIAGCHLYDSEQGAENEPYVRRLFPGLRMVLITLAERNIGLVLPAGNPQQVKTLPDLARPGLRFVNRQPGSGVRVWLDAALRAAAVNPALIQGYGEEKMTHLEVAAAVAEGEADCGICLQAAAASYGLDFIGLRQERYELVLKAETFQHPAVQALLIWLNDPLTHHWIEEEPGYQARQTGQVRWVE